MLWLSRDKTEYGRYNVTLRKKKPFMMDHGMFYDIDISFCAELFHKATNARLKKGKCRKLKEIIFVFEEEK